MKRPTTAAERDALVAELQGLTFRESVGEEANRIKPAPSLVGGDWLWHSVEGGSPSGSYWLTVCKSIRHRRACTWETDTSKAERDEWYLVAHDSVELTVMTGRRMSDKPNVNGFVRADDVLANVPGVAP